MQFLAFILERAVDKLKRKYYRYFQRYYNHCHFTATLTPKKNLRVLTHFVMARIKSYIIEPFRQNRYKTP